MTQSQVSFVDFTPSTQTAGLFRMRINQFLDFVPIESQVTVLVKKVDDLAFKGTLLMNTAWGEFKVLVDDSSPEILLERLGTKLKNLVNLKRQTLSTALPKVSNSHDSKQAAEEILEVEHALSAGG